MTAKIRPRKMSPMPLPVASASQSQAAGSVIVQRAWYPISIRGDVRYMPAAMSCFRSASSSKMLNRSTKNAPTDEAVSSKKPRMPGDSRSSVLPAKPYRPIWLSVSTARSRERMNARPRRATAIAVRSRPTKRVRITTPLYLDVDDLLDDERAAGAEHSSEDEQDLSAKARRQRMHVGGVDHVQEEHDRDRDRRDDPPRHATLNGQRLHQSAQLEALADRLGDAVDALRGVPACLALELCDERDLLEIAARHSGGHERERVLERDPELLVCDHPLHLGLHGLGGALDDDGKRPGETVARAQRRRHHLERVRKLLRELVPSPRELANDELAADQRYPERKQRP